MAKQIWKRGKALLSNKMASLRWHQVLPLLAILILLALVRWSWVPPSMVSQDCSLVNNGAWISVDWTSTPVDRAAVEELAASALRKEIRYLFPFTAYVKSDGSFNPTFAHAAEFVSTFRSFNQETLLLAWIGVPLHSDRQFALKGWVDLSQEDTRQRIAAFSKQLTTDVGFDGIHLDVEHVDNNDPDYLLLLDDVKDAIGSPHMLSVASNDWVPTALNVLPLIGNYKWSDGYFQDVGDRVDQIAAMTYDSLMPHAALYRFWLREEVKGLNRALSNFDAQLLVGLSISRENTTTHHPQVENMQSGLAGICAGLMSLPQRRHKVEGVAIYAMWEATPRDWQTWTDWVVDSP